MSEQIDYDGMDWPELQSLAKDRLGSGAGTREDITAALQAQDADSPTGEAQAERDRQADETIAGTDEAEPKGPTVTTAAGDTYDVEPGATGTEITKAIGEEIGVDPKNARAYSEGGREGGGNVRPADGRFLDPETTEHPNVVEADDDADDKGDE